MNEIVGVYCINFVTPFMIPKSRQGFIYITPFKIKYNMISSIFLREVGGTGSGSSIVVF